MRSLLVLALLAACSGGDTKKRNPGDTGADDAEPAVYTPLTVFPSMELVGADGRLALPDGLLPMVEDGTPFPVDRVNGRDGFSPAQTALVDLGIALDPASLPPAGDLSPQASVQLWDLDAGERLPALVELDAYPENDEPPVLLVRPLRVMTRGHSVAVALTGGLRTAGGEPVEAPGWYSAAIAGEPVGGLHQDGATTAALDEALASLGVEDRLLAFSFPVGDGGATTRHIAATVELPSGWTWTEVQAAALPGDLGEGIYKILEGTYTTDDWLGEEGQFHLEDGLPVRKGSLEADLYILIPESVRDAEPGSVPVWQFGHGIFSNPFSYLGNPSDPSGVIRLANDAGVIVVSTSWPGLNTADITVPISVAADFGRIVELTDRLSQGVANHVALSRLVLEGGLLEDPAFEGLPAPGSLRYFGISLGGIAGAVMMANNPRIEHGVLHVGGSSWSTMLERSSNWTQFEVLLSNSIPSARDRQQLITASQLLWDEADPAAFALELQGRSLLWQESIGDEQVPNLTTESLARALDLPLLSPAATSVAGLEEAPAPLRGAALVQLDPELALPPESNRPAPDTNAHSIPRHWPGMHRQTMRFLDPDDPGVVEHFCGDAVCSASNPGE